jgi:AraC-like DNA-binding protein
VCDGFRLYELEFRTSEGVFLEGESIRGFQWLGGELVANSYSGVYRGGERLLDLDFNDGKVLEYDGWGISMGQFVLRWPLSRPDELELIHWPEGFTRDGVSYFDRRDGVVWKDRLWWYSYGRFGVFEEDIWKVLTSEIDVFAAIPMENELLLSTRNDGVWRFDGERFESMEWPQGIEYNDVHALGANRFLCATNHGLAIADQETGDFELRSIDEGIPSASVCAIVEDEWGTFWVSTFGGVIRYSLEHGVLEHHAPLVEFNRFSHAQTPDGAIAFGSTRGIYTFHPTPPDLPKPALPWDWLVGLLVLVIGIGFLRWRMEVRKMKAQEAASAERMLSLERQTFLAQIREGIYRDLQGASVDSMADALEVSRRTLYRKCAEFDIKPSVLIREIRVEQARKFLDQGDLTFAEVASRVGYSPNHLRRVMSGEE